MLDATNGEASETLCILLSQDVLSKTTNVLLPQSLSCRQIHARIGFGLRFPRMKSHEILLNFTGGVEHSDAIAEPSWILIFEEEIIELVIIDFVVRHPLVARGVRKAKHFFVRIPKC